MNTTTITFTIDTVEARTYEFDYSDESPVHNAYDLLSQLPEFSS